MIDIDRTLLIHLINFIVLVLILHFVLFQPIRRIMREREQGISAGLNDAKESQDRVQALTEKHSAALAEAKQKATAAYNGLYQQGVDGQRDLVSAERTKAGEALDRARAEVAAASTAAQGELKAEAERLSREIAAKLLGRAV